MSYSSPATQNGDAAAAGGEEGLDATAAGSGLFASTAGGGGGGGAGMVGGPSPEKRQLASRGRLTAPEMRRMLTIVEQVALHYDLTSICYIVNVYGILMCCIVRYACML
jgi:hypothetical protein